MKELTTSFTTTEKNKYMTMAMEEAAKAQALGEVPIGAIVLHQGKVVGRGHNLRETTQEATSHAEILAIQDACRTLGSWRLEECQLFVTLEPCPMCSGAILLSRVEEVYFGAADHKAGVAGTLMNLLQDARFNHQAYVEGGVLALETGQLLTTFFRTLRQQKKQRKEAHDHDSEPN